MQLHDSTSWVVQGLEKGMGRLRRPRALPVTNPPTGQLSEALNGKRIRITIYCTNGGEAIIGYLAVFFLLLNLKLASNRRWGGGKKGHFEKRVQRLKPSRSGLYIDATVESWLASRGGGVEGKKAPVNGLSLAQEVSVFRMPHNTGTGPDDHGQIAQSLHHSRLRGRPTEHIAPQ